MNMISTAFPIETDASNKPETLAKKFASVWEKKNSKTARAGGVSLMALSLAACGAEDETPFAQSDIDAATAPISASLVAAQTQAATALVAQATAETTAATALVAQAGAEAAAATALVAQAAAETTAATLTVAAATATAAKEVAEAALVVAEAAKATAEADLATAQASLATETAAKVAAEGSLATVQASYDALIAPKSLSLTNSATADTLQGGPGNDAFTGAAGTLAAADAVRDASAVDDDTLTITDTDGTIGAFTVQNVENVNININSLTAQVDVDATNYSGVNNLTITRGDIVVGGATLTGATRVDAVGVNANNTAAVTAGGGTTVMNVTQQGQAGVTVNANEASGAVSIIGAATVNATGMGLGDTLTITGMTQAQAGGTLALEAVQNAIAVNVTTNAATVTLANGAGAGAVGNLDGVVDINAVAASVVTVPDAAGGVTVAALGSAANGVDIRGVDASGVNVTTTFAGTAAAPGVIDLGAIAVAGVVGTVKANGFVALETGVATDSIDTLNLEGNGAAVTYTVVSTNGALTTLSATSDVTVAGNAAEFSGVTISGSAAAINLASTSATGVIDADGWSSTQVGVAYNNLGGVITAAQGQNFVFTQVQTGLDFDYVAAVTDQDITITAGDVNGTSSTIGDLTLQALDVTSGTAVSGTVSLIANDANIVATSVTAAATQDIVITGDEDVNLGTVATANSVNSQGSTGVLTITAGAANQSISSGSGADQLTLNGNVIHTVDAGAGIDALTITSTAPTSTIDGGAGADTFTLTDVDQYVVIGGTGGDTFNVGVTSAATVIGGADSDTLTFTAAVNLAAGFTASGVEKVNIAATGGTTDFTVTEFAGLTAAEITSSGTDDTIQITALAAGSTLDLSALTIASGSTPNISVVTGAGADTITGSTYGETIIMNDLTGADDISGGATGIDTITTNNTTIIAEAGSNTSTGIVLNMGGSNISGVDILSNLAGNNYLGKGGTTVASDTMAFIYGAVDTLSVNSTQLDSITGIENFTSSDAAGVEYIVGTSGANVINVGAGADYVVGGAGNDTITLGADTAVDTGLGGDGSDSFVYGVTTNFAATSAVIDSINGGAGTTDAISINNQAGTFTIAAADDLVRITNVEQIKAAAATAQIITITTHTDANIDGFDTVDLSADTNAIATNVINVAATTIAGATGFTLTGSAGIDDIDGGASVDNITGGSGNDVIQGNGGADTIVGGVGADDILYVLAADGGTTGDVITGFVSTSDDIIINGALETAVDISAGAIVASAQATAGTVLALQLETAELFFMSTADNNAETASVTAANLGNLTMVAALVDEATTQSDAGAVAARTILIAIQASDAITSSGLYTYTQSSAGDTTYGASEFTHLATITSDTLVAGDITL
jgi:Ca2+-binding RTX toxin-like protein